MGTINSFEDGKNSAAAVPKNNLAFLFAISELFPQWFAFMAFCSHLFIRSLHNSDFSSSAETVSDTREISKTFTSYLRRLYSLSHCQCISHFVVNFCVRFVILIAILVFSYAFSIQQQSPSTHTRSHMKNDCKCTSENSFENNGLCKLYRDTSVYNT